MELYLKKFEKKEVGEYANQSFNNQPLVSILVLTYNHFKYIKQCIDSILEQKTNFSIEILIGDDESNDGTREICIDYSNRYPKIIRLFLHHRENNIKINGLNSGRYNYLYTFSKAKGKYIANCEGDDYWTDPLKLQKQVDFLEGNLDYVCCFHLCEILREDLGGQISKQPLDRIKYDYTIQNLLSYWNIPTASIVFRHTEPINFPSWFTNVASGDIALLMLIYEKGKFKLIEEYMSVYRITGGGVSISHSKFRMIHYRAVLYSHLNEYFNFKYEKEIYNALYHIYIKYAVIGNVKKRKVKERILTILKKKIIRRIKQIFK
ncbi:MAG: glycosyltransferase family 2 protein [Flavobacteriaceae bacterium]|nr:glycosyltransferase family 2 protein [Flavobacteriaceae bacterium]